MWAATQADVKIINHHATTLDYASATGAPLGGSAGAAFAATKDGTHRTAHPLRPR